MAMNPLILMLLGLAAFVAFILFIVFVLVPIFRGIGCGITAFFRAIGWLIAHIFEFIGGMISDVVRLLGSLLALIVLSVLVPANVIIARWSAAGHFARAVKREATVALGCLYRVSIRRPLKLFWLHGLVEGLEERVPEAMYAAPTSDTPGKRAGQYDGYTIVGSLPGGGSGGKLYIARPDAHKRRDLAGEPDLIVIKSFALSEGSSLPQIVRESRALECAKQLGHVLEHGMDEHRFHYVMPYHAGDNLAVITRDLHARTDGRGLPPQQLHEVMSFIRDLLATLSLYHAGGFWHKDVKPENVIVHDGRAHLVDLGLITPLKSAMTLTTHGTEYFRDPEMVRQALRGVKVHQVNGAKFDIYAVGAVLYFMIENTFPAHGGLSRFTHQSPEALRWIVRRAMAEYNQRYESAEMMLADLEAVTTADDPFSVKPAQLPSMKANRAEDIDVEIETESPQVEQARAAGSPIPPRLGDPQPAVKVFGLGAGVGSRGPFARAGGFSVDDQGNPVRTGAEKRLPERRPKLRVTNWLTGDYVVDDPGSASRDGDGAGAGATAHRAATVAPLHGRTTAREQLRAAQARAKEMRRRASQRRHAAGFERQPSVAVVLLSLLFVAVLIGLALLIAPSATIRPAAQSGNVVAEQAADEASMAAIVSGGRPLLLVFETDLAAHSHAHSSVRRIVEQYQNRGYNVIEHLAIDPETPLALMHNVFAQPRNEQVKERFEDFLAEHDLYGFLHIRQATSSGGAEPSLFASIVRSARPEANARRWPTISMLPPPPPVPGEPDVPGTGGSFLLINDHPARADQRVIERVGRLIRPYEAGGWTITTDNELEAAARKMLPAGVAAFESLDSRIEPSDRLHRLLREHDFDGLLFIFATPGDAPAHERIGISALRAADAEQ